ncbi:DUF4091 domain-containing protein [Meiothermus granaticius]|uniref:Glycoside hydrolase 123 C-terminal domain-containing protein n=1 Tax=Meiothermus granaticius NBRC 107808 TaxID=1227551 RepID=A0A399FED2_9DEIN|nr:DUF4091 domain-containing protein [Meiothermus granaticius]RIH93442.1 hypothetical protein Mgrana_00699 [Meiothermus granaticius NBRC 107808]GEM87690.1 hypothetical protein MGR01S_23150 [Meiothermus granaticius NBRC 107808]
MSWLRRSRLLLVLLPALTGCPAMSPLAAIDPSGPLRVWAVSSLERVMPETPPQENKPIELFAARGEYESFQVVVFGPKGLRGVNLQVSDLSGPGGAVIAKDHLSLYREHYLPVSTPSPHRGGPNRPLGKGWYPDALIPFDSSTRPQYTPDAVVYGSVPIDVAPGNTQAFWIDLYVPREAPPGLYTGQYTVSAANGQAQGEIRLRVWNFELPVRPTLQSFAPLWFTHTTAAKLELLRNRIQPGRVQPKQLQLLSPAGLNLVELGIGAGANYHNCQANPAPPPEVFRKAKEALNTDLPVYDFAFDEVDHCDLSQALRDWGRSMHQAGVLQIATVSPTPELLDDGSGRPAVDVFVLNAAMYEKAKANGMLDAARAKGARIWYYSALVLSETPGAPNWQLDVAPMNFRISSGFFAQALGFSGILDWAADYVTKGQDPWQDVSYLENKTVYQADGLLVYPGDKVGLPGTVVPSMRLKWLRDGVEDYEYVELLKKNPKLYAQYGWRVERLVPGLESWSPNPAELEATRRAIGEALSQP